MSETIKTIVQFQNLVNESFEANVQFNKDVMTYIGTDSEGGIELTCNELKALKQRAEEVQYKSFELVQLCSNEIHNKAREDMKRFLNE